MLFTNTSYPNVRKLCHDTAHSQWSHRDRVTFKEEYLKVCKKPELINIYEQESS